MTNKHTLGPWKFVANHSQNACAHVRGAEGEVATVWAVYPESLSERNASGTWPDQPVRDATARLIAAAPELLEAAMAFIAPFDGIEVVQGGDIAKARAAIAKATGK